jgi:hypothetical protein
MKRTVDRDQNLPAFACDPPSLQTLISALLAHFGDGEKRLSIDVKLKNEELSFSSMEELMSQQAVLPNTVRDIWISIRDWKSDSTRSVRLSSRYRDMPSVKRGV